MALNQGQKTTKPLDRARNKQDARRHDLQLGLVLAGSQANQRLGGDRLTSRLAMCANVADKRPLHMHTLANGKCVSAAYTHPNTHTDGHANCTAHQMPFA